MGVSIGTCIIFILGLYYAGLLGGRGEERTNMGDNRWDRIDRNSNSGQKQSRLFWAFGILCVWAFGILSTFAVRSGGRFITPITNQQGKALQTGIVQNLPEEVQDVIRTSLAQPTVQVATGSMILLTIFGNLFVISIIANIMGRKNPNFRKTKRAASLVIWCLFLGILFMVNNQRRMTSQMQSVRIVSTTSSEKPELFQNNGIVPIPEKVQAELRSELKQAATPETSPKSNQSKKPTKPTPEDIVEYKLQSAPCATQDKARAEVEEKLRQLIAERLKKYNLTDEQAIRTTMESLPRKTVISEAIKEVAGEKYPIYTGTIEITLGRDFDRGIVRQLTSLSARNRYEWLMAGSVLAVVFLALLDRFFLAGANHTTVST